MSRTTIENASLSLTVNNVGYEFSSVINIAIADPQENTMSGSPQGKGEGVIYRTGTTQAVTSDMTVREVPKELYQVLIAAYKAQTRIQVLLFDQITGDNYQFNSAVIRNNPSNGTFAEGEEQLNVPLNIACPPHKFIHDPAVQAGELA